MQVPLTWFYHQTLFAQKRETENKLSVTRDQMQQVHLISLNRFPKGRTGKMYAESCS